MTCNLYDCDCQACREERDVLRFNRVDPATVFGMDVGAPGGDESFVWIGHSDGSAYFVNPQPYEPPPDILELLEQSRRDLEALYRAPSPSPGSTATEIAMRSTVTRGQYRELEKFHNYISRVMMDNIALQPMPPLLVSAADYEHLWKFEEPGEREMRATRDLCR